MDVVCVSSVCKEASDPWSLKLSLLFCAFLGLLWKAQVTWAGKEKALRNRHLYVPPVSSIHGSMQGTAVGCLHGETWLDKKRTASCLFPILKVFKTGTWVILRAGSLTHSCRYFFYMKMYWMQAKQLPYSGHHVGDLYCWFIQVSQETQWVFGLASDCDEPVQHPECLRDIHISSITLSIPKALQVISSYTRWCLQVSNNAVISLLELCRRGQHAVLAVKGLWSKSVEQRIAEEKGKYFRSASRKMEYTGRIRIS